MENISIIIPAYNAAQYILKAVYSVINQANFETEILVVDDGSTDDTHNKLSQLIEKQKIRYIYQKNCGAAAARNLGIMESSGELIGFLDADDNYLNGMILHCVNRMKNEDLDLVSVDNYLTYCDEQYELQTVSQQYNWIETDPEDLYCTFLKVGAIGGIHKAFFRKSVFNVVGLLDTNLPVYEDLDLWIRIANAGLKWGHIRKPLVQYYDRGQGTSLFNISQRRNQDCRLCILHRYKTDAIRRCPGIKKDFGELLWNFGRSYLISYGCYRKGLKCLVESVLTDPDLPRVWSSIYNLIVKTKKTEG